jgi:GNAT superfamily N-acetyltransferase
MFSAAPPSFGFSAERVGGALCARAAGVPARELNRVHGEVGDVAAVLAHYGGQSHIICGGSDPGHGYTEGYAWMKFAAEADASAHADTDLVIEQVGPQGGVDFALPVRTAFGMPEAFDAWLRELPGRAGWTCLVGYDGGRAVAAGALYVDGDQGWLGMAGTLPEARGRGAQSAILARRIALAAEQGASTVTTETGVGGGPSYRNILRAGFTEAYERPNWDSPQVS